MGSIVSYARRAGKKKAPKRDEIMYGKLVRRLRENPATKYTIAEAENLADEVLKIGKNDGMHGAVPVVKIAMDFGFRVFKLENLDEKVSGNIYVGGTTADIYDTDKAIIVGDDEEYYHQRFIIAHELGHYLMDYLGSPESMDSRTLFSRTYPKENHDSSEEKCADRFAAQLLMPANAFCRRYLTAMERSHYNLLYAVPYLSHYFDVKETSVQKRMRELML